MMQQHETFMMMAIKEAFKGEGKTSPNPFVGAVLVKSKKVISKGYTQKAGKNHAEIECIHKAGKAAKGASLYVTLEPCSYFGKTPPCTQSIIESGVKEVVIGMKDPNPLVNGKGIQLLRKAGIKVAVGVLKSEIKSQQEVFLKYITSKYPFVCMKTAATLDGKITVDRGKKYHFTSDVADRFTDSLRSKYDAILVGTNTVLIDNPNLTCKRGNNHPIRVILDEKLEVPLTFNVLNQVSSTLVFTKRKKIPSVYKSMTNIEVIPLEKGGKNTFDLREVMETLRKRSISSVLVEGGGMMNASLIQAKLVDKVHIIYTPFFVGGKDTPTVMDGVSPMGSGKMAQFKDLQVQQMKNDILVTGYLESRKS